jgi:type IV pilus modification protein PilV
MKRRATKGFTIVEVLIAIVMLSIGVLALASSSGSTTRMMQYGRMKTDATAIAQSVLDSLRYFSEDASPKCSGLADGSLPANSPKRGFTTAWDVTASGDLVNVMVTVAYRVGPRNKADTVTSSFFCL